MLVMAKNNNLVTIANAKIVSKYLVEHFDPECIVVFGSVSKYGKGNDLDLLIATKDDQKNTRELNADICKSLKPFFKKFAIDPFVVPKPLLREYFLKGSPFLRMVQREGRCLYMKESVKEWLKQAKEDLDTAEYLIKGGYYRGACYCGQQAIEKTIKGALIGKGWELEKTHSIERLLAIAQDYGIMINIPEDDIIFIDSIYRGRYPAEEGLLPTGEPTEADAKRVLQTAWDAAKQLIRE
ncbi:MAG: HEPN domain-containing protein [Elusimicrobia bacterium]|nr:HEPN domain-containing protein [Elusimicrobiota bacterium]